MKAGNLLVVDGYYYRKYGKPHWGDGVTDRKWRHVGGKMIDERGRVHDWRKEADEHRSWLAGG